MSNHRQPRAGSPYTGTGSSKSALTSQRIAEDIDTFNKAGGRIEVLGNTPFNHRLKGTEASANAAGSAMISKQSVGEE